MEIIVKNDGKGKAQSYEAELHEYSDGNYWGHWELHLSGYGANEYSAKENLKLKFYEMLGKWDENNKD